jgi:hypothetical protein
LYLISEISDTKAHAVSKIIKGSYFNIAEAKQAILAPIKFSTINDKSLLVTFPITFRKYAKSI